MRMRAPWKPCRPWRSMGPSGSRRMAGFTSTWRSGRMPSRWAPNAAGGSVRRGRPFGPPGPARAEALRVEPLPGRAGDVLPARLGLHGLLDARAQVQEPRVVDGHLERQRLRIVADDVDGPHR